MELDAADGFRDPGGYLEALQGKQRQLLDGIAAGREGGDGADAKGLVLAGMGFSGAGSDLVRDACSRVLEVPVTIVKHYRLPQHVQKGWRVLAVSYSGQTEETLAVAREAKRRGVPVTAFSTGGALVDLADSNVPQPTGYQPRMAFAHAWGSLLGYLEGSGLVPELPVAKMAAAVQAADDECGPGVPEAQNPAKRLARVCASRLLHVYATPALTGVAYAFRAWLNENAKRIATEAMIPECNHNELTGWGGDPEGREHFACVVLSHAAQNDEMQRRIDYMAERYQSWDVPWHRIQVPPITDFEEHVTAQAGLLQTLDYVSFYTAMLRGVDPCEIKEIVALKGRLRAA